MSDNTSSLDLLDPPTIDVTIGDELFTVSNFKFLEFNKITKILQSDGGSFVFDVLAFMNSDEESDLDVQIVTLVNALAKGGDVIASIIKTYLKKDDAWMEALEMEQVMDLVAAIASVNKDFFMNKLMARATSISESLIGESSKPKEEK